MISLTNTYVTLQSYDDEPSLINNFVICAYTSLAFGSAPKLRDFDVFDLMRREKLHGFGKELFGKLIEYRRDGIDYPAIENVDLPALIKGDFPALYSTFWKTLDWCKPLKGMNFKPPSFDNDLHVAEGVNIISILDDCIGLAGKLGLRVKGWDFRMRTASDAWICLGILAGFQSQYIFPGSQMEKVAAQLHRNFRRELTCRVPPPPEHRPAPAIGLCGPLRGVKETEMHEMDDSDSS